MQADGKAWLYAPAGLCRRPAAGALRAAGLPVCRTCCTRSSATRSGEVLPRPRQPLPAQRRTSPGRRCSRTSHHLPADRAPHGGRDEPVAAVPVGAAARDVLRGVAGTGRRAGPGAPGLGHDRHRPRRDRGPGPGHRADAAADRAGHARCTRSGCPTTGARTVSRPGTRPTTWRRSRSIPTCTSRRSRRSPWTSSPAAGRAGRPCSPWSAPTSERAGITDETGTEV